MPANRQTWRALPPKADTRAVADSEATAQPTAGSATRPGKRGHQRVARIWKRPRPTAPPTKPRGDVQGSAVGDRAKKRRAEGAPADSRQSPDCWFHSRPPATTTDLHRRACHTRARAGKHAASITESWW